MAVGGRGGLVGAPEHAGIETLMVKPGDADRNGDEGWWRL